MCVSSLSYFLLFAKMSISRKVKLWGGQFWRDVIKGNNGGFRVEQIKQMGDKFRMYIHVSHLGEMSLKYGRYLLRRTGLFDMN